MPKQFLNGPDVTEADRIANPIEQLWRPTFTSPMSASIVPTMANSDLAGHSWLPLKGLQELRPRTGARYAETEESRSVITEL